VHLVGFHYKDYQDARSAKHKKITFYLLFVLYIVTDDGLITPKDVANASERENKLCSDQ
jgi:hypothetical protein